MSDPKVPGRWDGWADPNYQPTREELEEPIILPSSEHATPEDLARAILRPARPVDGHGTRRDADRSAPGRRRERRAIGIFEPFGDGFEVHPMGRFGLIPRIGDNDP